MSFCTLIGSVEISARSLFCTILHGEDDGTRARDLLRDGRSNQLNHASANLNQQRTPENVPISTRKSASRSAFLYGCYTAQDAMAWLDRRESNCTTEEMSNHEQS